MVRRLLSNPIMFINTSVAPMPNEGATDLIGLSYEVNILSARDGARLDRFIFFNTPRDRSGDDPSDEVEPHVFEMRIYPIGTLVDYYPRPSVQLPVEEIGARIERTGLKINTQNYDLLLLLNPSKN